MLVCIWSSTLNQNYNAIFTKFLKKLSLEQNKNWTYLPSNGISRDFKPRIFPLSRSCKCINSIIAQTLIKKPYSRDGTRSFYQIIKDLKTLCQVVQRSFVSFEGSTVMEFTITPTPCLMLLLVLGTFFVLTKLVLT